DVVGGVRILPRHEDLAEGLEVAREGAPIHVKRALALEGYADHAATKPPGRVEQSQREASGKGERADAHQLAEGCGRQRFGPSPFRRLSHSSMIAEPCQ